MAKIVAIKISGEVSDLRFVPDPYKLGANEILLPGDSLPDVETLYDSAVLAAKKKSEDDDQKIKDEIVRWNREQAMLRLGMKVG